MVEDGVGGKFLCEQTVSFRSPAPISSIWVIYKMEREYAWSLEVESKLAEVILQREKWNLFWDHISYVDNHQKINGNATSTF